MFSIFLDSNSKNDSKIKTHIQFGGYYESTSQDEKLRFIKTIDSTSWAININTINIGISDG